MTFIVERKIMAPDFVRGEFKDFNEKVPDLIRRSDISMIFKQGEELLRPEETPEHLLVDFYKKRLRDIFTTVDGAIIVSDSLRNLMEEMDPGCHQFLPISIENYPDTGTWFMLNVHKMQDSIVDDQSEVNPFFLHSENEMMEFKLFKSGDDPGYGGGTALKGEVVVLQVEPERYRFALLKVPSLTWPVFPSAKSPVRKADRALEGRREADELTLRRTRAT